MKKPVGFIIFDIDSQGKVGRFALAPDMDRAILMTKPPNESADGSNKNQLQPPSQFPAKSENLDDLISKLIDRFLLSMNGYRGIALFSNVVGNFISSYYVETNIFNIAKNKMKLELSEGNHQIYSYDMIAFMELRRGIDEFQAHTEGRKALPVATLLSLVAAFDFYFSDTIKIFYKQIPDRFNNSSRTISVKDILDFDNFDDVIEFIVDSEVNELMRGSHSDQIKFVESYFKVKLSDIFDRGPQFLEIFERRNLAAHGSLIVNKIYLDNCKKFKYNRDEDLQLGSNISVESKYINESISTLTEFGMLLIFLLWQKHSKDHERVFRKWNEVAYDLIENKRYRIALRILEFATKCRTDSCSDSIYRMIIVNRAVCLVGQKKQTDAIALLDQHDWSAVGANFQICIASLRQDLKKGLSLVRAAFNSDDVNATSFRTWPALEWLREQKETAQIFEDVYGEPLFSEISISSQDGEIIETEINDPQEPDLASTS